MTTDPITQEEAMTDFEEDPAYGQYDYGINAILAERIRQTDELGWDALHDADHGTDEWLWLIEKRLLELRDPFDGRPSDLNWIRNLYAQIGALAAAALDALVKP